MTLHPQARAAIDVQPRQPMARDNLVAIRASMVDAIDTETDRGPMVPVVVDVDADGVPGRLYDPRNGHGAPVLVYLHGGGWTLGDLDTHDAVCRRLADRSGCAVLAVDYRLAPEHAYPAAIEDVEAAVAWLRAHAGDLGVDGGRVAISGDSAGGHLAAVVARRGRDAGVPYLFQALVYPIIDPTMTSGSYAEFSGYGLGAEEMAFYWDAFAPGDRTDPDLAPSAAKLEGLPPALVITAEYDVLRDEGEAYAAALSAAGVSAVAVRYQGMIHGFFRKPRLFDAAHVAIDQVAAAVRDALEG